MENQKAIENVYGSEYIHADTHGWMKYGMYCPGDLGFSPDEVERYGDAFLWRPKSLTGIENNNGWIKIESEDDLPKDEDIIEYWVIDDDEIVSAQFMHESKKWYDGGNLDLRIFPTHYQPIHKPLKPIY